MHATPRLQFTLRGLILAIGFFAIDFSVVVPLWRSTEPCRLVNWGVALVASGYLLAAFLTIAGAESAESGVTVGGAGVRLTRRADAIRFHRPGRK